MIDTDTFVAQIKLLMQQHELSTSTFAETIAVNRTTITHILSGRNKPSLEVALKIVNAFPPLSLDELVLGKKSKIKESQQQLKLETESIEKITQVKENTSKLQNRQLHRIVIFYDDGTFESFLP